MHMLIYIGIWFATIFAWSTLSTPANHPLIDCLLMESPTQVPINSSDFILAINDIGKHIVSKDVFNTICSLGISSCKPTRRGKRGGRKHRRRLAHIPSRSTGSDVNLFSLNCQSVKAKSTKGIITDLIVEHQIQIFCLTETWLAGNQSDDFYLRSITPPGYDIFNVPRGGRDAHGGVAVLYQKGFKVVSKTDNSDRHIKSFEYCSIVFTCESRCFTVVTIYRPYPSPKNRFTTAMFFEEFCPFMQDLTIAKGDLVVVGDLNLHLDISDDPSTLKFGELMNTLGLKQSVTGPTHRCGHTLDVVISRENDNLVGNTHVLDLISDHALVACALGISKPHVPRTTITSRKFRSIDLANLNEDIVSGELTTSLANTVDVATEQYNKVLSELLDHHAPSCTKSVVPRVQQPWFCDSLHQAKRERRKAERKWIASGLTVDFEHFKQLKNKYNSALYSAKCDFFNRKILDCGNDYKSMFSVIGDILKKKGSAKLPDHSCSSELANRFATYFTSKIETIRLNLASSVSVSSEVHPTTLSWNEFNTVSETDIKDIIMKSPSASGLHDPMPTWLIKKALNSLLHSITSIVNMSLTEGVVPSSMKSAVIKPLLKKENLDCNILKNYRPVSNLTFLSKVLERAVAMQLKQYMSDHNLHEPFQSAYKQFHSTESALLKVHNDVLCAMENQGVTVLVLLDLSSAFDTIDHAVLLARLHHHLGVDGTILDWFKSYLYDRTQCVYINGKFSAPKPLKYGVPQGSVLGPLLFSIYILPLGDIIRRHGMELHIYADDTQIYFCVCPTTTNGVKLAVSSLEKCVKDVNEWMSQNFLKLNADKTEVIILGFRAQLAKIDILTVNIAGVDIAIKSDPVKNLGVMFDCGLTMEAQVANITRSANFHLANIGRARKMLTTDSTKLAVHTLVTSRLDYCNGLLTGINKCLLQRLQNVQRTAARLITRKRKYDPISDDLVQLHWLPIKERIDFKILVLTYKSLHQQTPDYISGMLQLQTGRRDLRSSNAPQLVETRTRHVTFAARAFSNYAPHKWNQLPAHIRNASSIIIFKRLLKFHLFQLAYGQ